MLKYLYMRRNNNIKWVIIMKKLEDVIAKVRSPFTDNFIKELIELYINADCDFHAIYDAINKVNEENLQRNESINTLQNVIWDRGTSIADGKWEEDSHGKSHMVYETKPVYKENGYWMVLMSNPEAFKQYEDGDPEGKNLLYRIYLNVKGKDKLDCVMGYIEECHKRGLDYKFKFSTRDGRDDEIIIQSNSEHFLENLSIVEELTKQMQLGETPMLVGKYGNNIGVSEEYYNRLLSPTQARIYLLGASILKYICDHSDTTMTLCTDDEKRTLNYLLTTIKLHKEEAKANQDLADELMQDPEVDAAEVTEAMEMFNLIPYAKIDNVNMYEQNIFGSSDMYTDGSFEIRKLSGLAHRMYASEPEDFLNEITSNVRYIGNNVFGISKDMIFSVTTENNIEASKKKDTVDVDI